MRHIIPISGKDSLATALLQKDIEPDLDYEYVFNPTGAELPEVFSWLDKVETYLGKPIVRVGENLEEIIEGYNYFLPSRRARYCTRQSKIEPFEKWIGVTDAVVYYGIRADETRGGYNNSRYPNITPSYPLKDHGIDIDGVYQLINNAGLKPPVFFWKEVYDACCIAIGEERMRANLPEWMIDLLFCWRTRANCYFCFNQRKSEWVGLLEFYPVLFWKAEALEHSESEYFWNGKDYPLTKIVEEQTAIKAKHIKKLIKTIRQIINHKTLPKQTLLFALDTEEGFNDFFKTTSCGLFCGK